MTTNSNVQLRSNVYPVMTEGDTINFRENSDFVRRVWNREALIRLICLAWRISGDKDLLQKYAPEIPGIQQWQIRRLKTPDNCVECPNEKPWGIVIRDDDFYEVCRCQKKDCRLFAKCRPDMENSNGVTK